MNIPGISAFYHGAAACMLRDGEIVADGHLGFEKRRRYVFVRHHEAHAAAVRMELTAVARCCAAGILRRSSSARARMEPPSAVRPLGQRQVFRPAVIAETSRFVRLLGRVI